MKVLWDGDGVTPSPEQTHTCENITSRRTTYPGGKNTDAMGGLKYRTNACACSAEQLGVYDSEFFAVKLL